jgi:GNAT superfamily N-acetyltransferase
MPEVRPANSADVPQLAQALVRAFHDDPVMQYLLKPAKQAKGSGLFFESTAKRDLEHGQVWTTPGIEGGALWSAPGQWRLGGTELLKMTPMVVRAFGTGLLKALKTLSIVEKVHPTEPHWYLGVLGTDPATQGKGIGSALLQPVLDMCDTEGLPAYLESSKDRNVPFYARHGFTVTREVQLSDGPKLWCMWREPQA